MLRTALLILRSKFFFFFFFDFNSHPIPNSMYAQGSNSKT